MEEISLKDTDIKKKKKINFSCEKTRSEQFRFVMSFHSHGVGSSFLLLWGFPPADPRYFCFACFVLSFTMLDPHSKGNPILWNGCQRSIYQTHIMLTVKRKEKAGVHSSPSNTSDPFTKVVKRIDLRHSHITTTN